MHPFALFWIVMSSFCIVLYAEAIELQRKRHEVAPHCLYRNSDFIVAIAIVAET